MSDYEKGNDEWPHGSDRNNSFQLFRCFLTTSESVVFVAHPLGDVDDRVVGFDIAICDEF